MKVVMLIYDKTFRHKQGRVDSKSARNDKMLPDHKIQMFNKTENKSFYCIRAFDTQLKQETSLISYATISDI